MKKTKKLISVILACVLMFSVVSAAGAAGTCENGSCEYCPSIVIPGVFQSDVRLYDESGNEMLNSAGAPYSAPFFLEDTGDIIKLALKEALLPIGGMLITQQDKQARCAQAVADVLAEVLMGNIQCDANGNPIKDLRAVKYDTSLANLSEYDRQYALDQIPIQAFADIAGYDHLYFYSYLSTGSVKQNAEGLYDLIQTAKAETGHDKVNLVPISQGGSLFTALVQVYRDKGENLADDLNRVCYIVPAADGAAVLGDIYHYGLLDDNEALYGYMFPSLLDEDQEWLAYLINLILRIIPNADVNQILDRAVYTLVKQHMGYSTAMWALIPSKDYPDCREMYLSDPEDAVIRAEADWYYNAQCNLKDYIKELQADGVEFFDIVDYNYTLYKICDSWDHVNADGIIHTDSESFGATTIGVDKPLSDSYKQKNTYCTDPSHNHIDEARLVDASTGLLCETTFYFKGQDHEQTAKNDVIIRLAIRILTDSTFTDVYSDPAFPQFNYARNIKHLSNLLKRCENIDPESVPELYRKEYKAALAQAKEAYESTCMPTEEYNAAYERLDAITYMIANNAAPAEEGPTLFIRLITKLFKRLSEFMLSVFGGKSFSDIVLFR